MDSSTPDWRTSLSNAKRYDTVQQIQRHLGSANLSDAIAIEQAAFQVSSTEEQYLLACQPTRSSPSSIASDVEDAGEGEGVRIGTYTDCRPISEGVTSQVYRSGNNALKVIIRENIEPHNPRREAQILKLVKRPCIPLLDVFRDREQQFVLVFPFLPFTLADLLDKGPLPLADTRSIFNDALNALRDIHEKGIIHRDIKPSAILLQSPTGPAYLSDFGTAWHPELSQSSEPSDGKILDIGTGAYRAPETLFGNTSYGPPVDMWGIGVMLSEAIRDPPMPIFESRPAHEDGSQLGLILSIFKTLGTPTPQTWPEAKTFKVTPFALWTVFPVRSWDVILPDVDPDMRILVASLLRYDGQRATAAQALSHRSLQHGRLV
ncbi:kinase-like domain-containing protein [Dactylonectria estremocensis]|uniref:cyclin-dependent kinase n=1 Tax=Dactylonectria estremocensis TaxID=1079267 RepID=A0A9P9EA35_9HYPO|nr:kinase-like domain-containing protein [Dactylonectria estremocensis]